MVAAVLVGLGVQVQADDGERSGFERGETVELSGKRIRDRHAEPRRNTDAITSS